MDVETVVVCEGGKSCPHVGGGSILQVVLERDYLRERIGKMEQVMELARKEIEGLRQEIKKLGEEKESLGNQLHNAHRKQFKGKLKKEDDKPDIKRGAPVGHKGKGRRRSEKTDCRIDIWPDRCQDCGCENIRVYESSFQEHRVEDIQIRVITTSYRIHYGYCPLCKKTVYPAGRAGEVIAGSRIGPNARAVSGYFRYIGVPYRKTEKIFRDIFGLKITHPSLLNFDRRMAENGNPFYKDLLERVRNSSFIHADETGWRVDGQNHWLWNFINKDVALFRIEKSRGSEVVEETLGNQYGGILISDFYSSYNPIQAVAKQKCLVHLLRDLREIQQTDNLNENDAVFCQQLKTTLQEAMESWRKFHNNQVTREDLSRVKNSTAGELIRLSSCPVENENLKVIMKRMLKHNQDILTFLDNPQIEPTNNSAERGLRPSVIMRKITFGNRSEVGARNHSVIMSILQTGVLNNEQPLDILLSLTQKVRAP